MKTRLFSLAVILAVVLSLHSCGKQVIECGDDCPCKTGDNLGQGDIDGGIPFDEWIIQNSSGNAGDDTWYAPLSGVKWRIETEYVSWVVTVTCGDYFQYMKEWNLSTILSREYPSVLETPYFKITHLDRRLFDIEVYPSDTPRVIEIGHVGAWRPDDMLEYGETYPTGTNIIQQD